MIWIAINFAAQSRGQLSTLGRALICNRACICIHLHLFAHFQRKKNACKQTNKHGKYIYDLYIYVLKAPYMYICPVYTYIWRYIPLNTARAAYIYIYIYIYIYMQRKTLNHHMQGTGAAGSCSQHGIMIQ